VTERDYSGENRAVFWLKKKESSDALKSTQREGHKRRFALFGRRVLWVGMGENRQVYGAGARRLGAGLLFDPVVDEGMVGAHPLSPSK